MIAATRLRSGPASSSRRAASLVAERLSLARQVGAAGLILLRAWPMSSTMRGTRVLSRMARSSDREADWARNWHDGDDDGPTEAA